MGFFTLMARKIEYHMALRQKFGGKTARDKGLKVCQRCGGCCHVVPCAMSPKELACMAEAKDLTPSAFFLAFCVVSRVGDVPLAVQPRRVGQTSIAGRWVPSYRTWDTDPCVFWDKAKGCTMYRVRPKNARDMVCADASIPRVPKWSRKELKALGWDGRTNEEDAPCAG